MSSSAMGEAVMAFTPWLGQAGEPRPPSWSLLLSHPVAVADGHGGKPRDEGCEPWMTWLGGPWVLWLGGACVDWLVPTDWGWGRGAAHAAALPAIRRTTPKPTTAG